MSNVRKFKKKNRSIYVFPVLFIIICLLYIFRFFYYNIDTEVVKYDRIENTIDTYAVLVKKEWVTTLPEDINNDYLVNEGERVAFGTKLLEIQKGGTADSSINIKIQELSQRIDEIKKTNEDNNFFSSDKERINEKINDQVAEIKQIARSGDLERLDDAKEELAASLYKRSLIGGTDSFSGKNLEQLESEKATLEALYKNSMDVIQAPSSGIVSYEVDGLEQVLNPANIEGFNIEGIKEIIKNLQQSSKNDKNKEAKQAGVKIVDNFEWYMSFVLDTKGAKGLEEGKSLKLRATDYDDAEIDARVAAITEPVNGEQLVTVKCNNQFKDFYKLRITKVEVIREHYEGFAVSSNCIITLENTKGVYVNKGGIVKFVPVEVVTESGNTSLVKNVKSNAVDGASNWEKLKEFDEVIKSVKRVKENQILPGSF